MSRNKIVYSEAFKLSVVNSIESKGLSLCEAMRMYDIKGCGTLRSWLTRYGKTNLLSKKIVVMNIEERSEVDRLRAQVKELKEALVSLELRNLRLDSGLKVACRELGREEDFFLRATLPRS